MDTITEAEETKIVHNVLVATQDITKLDKRGYNYINLCSGFIAHYNLGGFIDHYSQESLTQAILENEEQNQWKNFRQGDKDYEYYAQKARIYKRICSGLEKQMIGVLTDDECRLIRECIRTAREGVELYEECVLELSKKYGVGGADIKRIAIGRKL